MPIQELQGNYTAELLLLAELSVDVGTNDENVLPSSSLKLFDIDLQDLIVNTDIDANDTDKEGPLYHIKIRQNQENIPDYNQEWVSKDGRKFVYY